MTGLKAGALGRLAAELGAGLATDQPETVRLLGDFGFNVFTYAQLIDDMRDACPLDGSQGDMAMHKKTLPVVFFYGSLLQSASGRGNGQARLGEVQECADVQREFGASGARVYCAIVAEAFLGRAKANVAALRSRVAEVRHLEEFLDSVVGSSAESIAAS